MATVALSRRRPAQTWSASTTSARACGSPGCPTPSCTAGPSRCRPGPRSISGWARTWATARHDRAGDPASWTPRHDVRVLRRASLYETAPVGVDRSAGLPQHRRGGADDALARRRCSTRVKRVERTLGRQSARALGAARDRHRHPALRRRPLRRAGLRCRTARMWERLFVLAPLAELRPDLAGPDRPPHRRARPRPRRSTRRRAASAGRAA